MSWSFYTSGGYEVFDCCIHTRASEMSVTGSSESDMAPAPLSYGDEDVGIRLM